MRKGKKRGRPRNQRRPLWKEDRERLGLFQLEPCCRRAIWEAMQEEKKLTIDGQIATSSGTLYLWPDGVMRAERPPSQQTNGIYEVTRIGEV